MAAVKVKILRRTQFGNPILRQQAPTLSTEEIKSYKTQQLIRDMRYTLDQKKYGVGLAAPQVGESIALSVIAIKPTPTRPKLERCEMVMINPVITKFYGHRSAMWEGCISGTDLYAKTLRYKRIRLQWQDEKAEQHEEDIEGFLAHVIQHEVDHLNGLLFVDRVKDTKTYMTFSEYIKMRKQQNK